MKFQIFAATAAAATAIAGTAAATDTTFDQEQEEIAIESQGENEVVWSYGVDFASTYASDGKSLSDGKAAIQPWVTASYNGFYAGAWFSNLVDGGEDAIETDIYVGYAGEFGAGFTYDISYTNYWTDDRNDDGDIKLILGTNTANKVWGAAEIKYTPQTTQWSGFMGTMGINLNEDFTLTANVGHDAIDDYEYWDLGVTYAIDDNVSLDLRNYQHNDDADDEQLGLVAMVSFAY